MLLRPRKIKGSSVHLISCFGSVAVVNETAEGGPVMSLYPGLGEAQPARSVAAAAVASIRFGFRSSVFILQKVEELLRRAIRPHPRFSPAKTPVTRSGKV